MPRSLSQNLRRRSQRSLGASSQESHRVTGARVFTTRHGPCAAQSRSAHGPVQAPQLNFTMHPGAVMAAARLRRQLAQAVSRRLTAAHNFQGRFRDNLPGLPRKSRLINGLHASSSPTRGATYFIVSYLPNIVHLVYMTYLSPPPSDRRRTSEAVI